MNTGKCDNRLARLIGASNPNDGAPIGSQRTDDRLIELANTEEHAIRQAMHFLSFLLDSVLKPASIGLSGDNEGARKLFDTFFQQTTVGKKVWGFGTELPAHCTEWRMRFDFQTLVQELRDALLAIVQLKGQRTSTEIRGESRTMARTPTP